MLTRLLRNRGLWRQYSKVPQLAKSQEEFLKLTRNIAIIAHVDHGKTTLVDSLLRSGGVEFKEECAMDSNQLEREKGITILSKCTSILHREHTINIVDTPGHHDFGGEVERIMGMVDGVCLVICATEGPMTQSKFVLRKALEQKLKPMVIVNKVDRPTARVSEVVNDVFGLFCDLSCPEEYLDYPLFYASGKNGWAVTDMAHERRDISCILDGIIQNIPAPKIKPHKTFSMLVTQTQQNSYFGKMALGRIQSGEVIIGTELRVYDQEGNYIENGKVTKIVKKMGLDQIQLDRAFAGDIVSLAGLPSCKVTHTFIQDGNPEKVIPCLKIDQPLMGISINVNTSPFAGKEGTKIALNDLKTRLKEEAENDVALFVDVGGKNSNSIMVRGRGDLHLGVLLEKIRREGYQFSVTPPEIVFKIDATTGEKLEPVEKVVFEVEDRFTGTIMEKMNQRKGVYLLSETIGDKSRLEFLTPTRALIGLRSELLNQTQGTAVIKTSFHKYEKYLGPLKRNPKGALLSMTDGMTTPYALKQLQRLGTLFVRPGQSVYNGLVIGECNKEEDLQVNPTKTKQLTNVRTHAHDEKIVLIPPKVMSIEEAICYVRSDELIQVTPKEVRIRKKELDKNGRERVRRQLKNQLKNSAKKY